MIGNYAIPFKKGNEPMTERTFSNFEELYKFVVANKTADWTNSVNVHLPSRATDEEREKIRNLGLVPN
ncbi:MAG: hypothetical protein ACHQRJ_04000 [Alphaproteobacteria bacterium]